MIGIIAAGGYGTRLYPFNITTNKHLLPVNDKPLIYYPITNLIAAGIKNIILCSDFNHLKSFKQLLGNGKKLGCKFEYVEQKKPNGIPEVLLLCKRFVTKNQSVTLLLGDNIFVAGGDFSKNLSKKTTKGASIFAVKVSNPSRFGVIELKGKKILSIQEKPPHPKSNYIIPGAYKFNYSCFDLIKQLKPSVRNELEIIELINQYLFKDQLEVNILRRGCAWFDAGTPNSIQQASNYIYQIEKNMGFKIGCPEEAAFYKGFITRFQLQKNINQMPECEYRDYLQKVMDDRNENNLNLVA